MKNKEKVLFPWDEEKMSYLYSMIDNNAYDTICHEHVCYYSLTQINWIAEKNDLKIGGHEESQDLCWILAPQNFIASCLQKIWNKNERKNERENH